MSRLADTIRGNKVLRKEFDKLCLEAHKRAWAKGFDTDYEYFKPYEEFCSPWMYEILLIKKDVNDVNK